MGLGSTAEDYKNALIALTPIGICWPTENNSTWVTLLEALAQEFARVDSRSIDLLDEAFPNTSTELLENWERVVGLPDAFSDPNATIEERQKAVMFKLQARGGQSAEYLSSLINALGYENEVLDPTPYVADKGTAGGYLFSESWTHYFLVIVHGTLTTEQKATFEARFKTVIPAQTIPVFIYES